MITDKDHFLPVKKFLDTKYEKTGGFTVRVHHRTCPKNTHECTPPPRWKDWKELAPAQQRRIFLRHLFNTEILFDVDYPGPEAARNAKKLLLWLKDKGYTAESWWTGSKGQHVKLEFTEMHDWTEEERKRARKWFFELVEKELGIKVDRAKQTGMVAVEMQPHFKKPWNYKSMSGCVRNSIPNKLPEDCVKAAMTEFVSSGPVVYTPSNLTCKEVIQHEYIQFIHSKIWTEADRGIRHPILLKNTAALCVDARLNDDEIHAVAAYVQPNFPGKTVVKDIMGWSRWFRQKW